jgi:hypothetical protein
MAIERMQSMSHLQLVAEVLGAGPVPPEEIRGFVAIYQRGLDEVARFLNAKRKRKPGKRG